ncbi:MAG: nucleotidyltransferase family protein [Gammaproteobacteria bacterium]|nr:nucleotidyltransferase family protein [Gammaproteobacteria bacterium]MDH4315747.1 nucleotidyltransferase family protein [Gammaproteobacteria bacterium]MDH5214147.1 nucleotidyltransferase family protein [Gammaproteobacteria bacterium]MDH5501893.1 nucleotidyltransferase family protein [Gammaproteobacteria bacterium]
MIAMILAAGRGERMRPVTDKLPKALVEVAGVSLLERHLQMLSAAGATTVVINLGWCGEQIVDRVGAGRAFGLHVVYSPEYENVLETGGGIQRALPLLGSEPFWVVNADIYTDYRIGDDVIAADSSAHLVLVPRPQHKKVGDFDLRDGKVSNSPDPSLTFSGIACYRPQFFADCKPGRFPLAPLLREAADQGAVSGSLFEGLWEDVGTPQRLARINSSLAG